MKNHVYRIEEEVAIMIPKRFIRCGYPMQLHEEKEKVRREFFSTETDVDGFNSTFCRKFGIKEFHWNKKSFERIISEIAFIRCQAKNFGGNFRELYEIDLPENEYLGRVGRVRRKFVCKTGERFYDQYYGPSFYCEKTHVILELAIYANNVKNPYVIEFLQIRAEYVTPYLEFKKAYDKLNQWKGEAK